MKHHFLIFIVIIVFSFTFVSCAKDYSKRIARGDGIYITKSKAGKAQLVDLLPVKATMSLEEMKDGRCELNILYEFDVDGGKKHHSSTLLLKYHLNYSISIPFH